MALAPSSDNIILGKGELFFDRFVSGARSGYFHLGNCARFAVILQDDILKINTSQDASAGLLKAVTRKRDINIEISSNEFAIANLAVALMGDAATFSQTTGTATETLTTTVTKGRFYRTQKRGIGTVTSIVQGTATLTATTDYSVYDTSAGVIRFPATSGAATTSIATVIVYTYSTLSLDQINGATVTKLEGSLLFVPDPTTGPQFDVEVWRASVAPGGEVGFISEEFGEYTMNMSALNDDAGTYGGSTSCPYFRLIQRGTAA